MNSLARKSSLLIWCAFMLLLVSGGRAWSRDVDTRELVEKVVREYVEASGHKVVGVGSWIKGRYRDPLAFPTDASDHDMTLLLEGNDRNKLAKQWKEAREFIRRRLKKELAGTKLSQEEAKRILKSVNVYPPDQLLAGVEDVREAVDRYKSLGGTPNLGGEPIEGLWGKGSLAFRQAYEAKTGRVFYRYQGKVYQGFVDLEHMARGYGKFSVAGTANLADQFADKAMKALERGEAKDLFKNLGRLELYLAKSESLARAKGKTAQQTGKLAKAIEEALEKLDAIRSSALSKHERQAKEAAALQEWLEARRGLIREALYESREQSALCRAIAASTDPRELRRLRQMLKDSRWRRIRRAVAEAWQKAGAAVRRVPLHRLFQLAAGLLVAVETYDLAETAHQEGLRVALAKAGIKAVTYTNLPAAVVQAVLEDARSAGVGLVTRFQDCEDLVAGIYSVKGRERLTQGRQIEDLARDYLDESLVRRLVALHARRAAQRVEHATRAERQSEEAVAERLTQRCAPAVVAAWRNRRLEMLAELIAAKQAVDRALSHTMLVLWCQRVLRDGRIMLRLEAAPTQARSHLLALFEKMEQSLKRLGGKQQRGFLMLKEVYRWRVGSKPAVRQEGTPLLGVARPPFFGYGYTTYQPLPADSGETPTVTLDYTLRVKVYSPAAEVDQFLSDLEGAYPFTARAELGPPRWKAVVRGPHRVETDKAATLSGRLLLDGEPVSVKGLDYIWSDSSGTRLGRGRRISWSPSRPGRYRVTLAVHGSGGRELARAGHELTVVEAVAPGRVRLSAERHTRSLEDKVALYAQVEGGRGPFTLQVRILSPSGGLYKEDRYAMHGRRARIVWGSRLSQAGVYRILARVEDARGDFSPWSPPVSITVRKPSKDGPKPVPPQPANKAKASAKPSRWEKLATFTGSFGSDTLYPGKHKVPFQGTHQVRLPGPGSLRVTFHYYHLLRPGKNSRFKRIYYGIGCRWHSGVRWDSPKEVAGSGYLLGGNTFRIYYRDKRKHIEDLKEVVSRQTLRVRSAGAVTFKLWGESCDGVTDKRFYGGKPYCCCSCWNKDWTWVMPGRYKLEVDFAPAR